MQHVKHVQCAREREKAGQEKKEEEAAEAERQLQLCTDTADCGATPHQKRRGRGTQFAVAIDTTNATTLKLR